MPRTLESRQSYTLGLQNLTEMESLAVTTSDTVDLPNGPCQALRALGAGNINVNLTGGGTAVLTGLVAGQIVRCDVSRVLATSTTVTAGIQALYPAGNL